jgi:hypothetical protein
MYNALVAYKYLLVYRKDAKLGLCLYTCVSRSDDGGRFIELVIPRGSFRLPCPSSYADLFLS